MSSRRRANAPSVPPTQNPVPVQQQQQQRPTDMTLPQVLQLLDSRLRRLEAVKPVVATENSTTTTTSLADVVAALKEEYESRFDILANEINNMKDIVLKLQSYTMDVNKTLLEERVHFMADLSDAAKETIVMTTTTTTNTSTSEEKGEEDEDEVMSE
jgi:hypothetical protein